METPIHILNLEDSAQDAELIQICLNTGGMNCDVLLVDSRETYMAALDRGGFDVILSDYSLISFDGLSALRIAKEKCPETPFILVSGFLGEEAAIECLKMGATDYVLKQRLSRLAPCIKRALQEAGELKARKMAEAQMRLQSTALEAAANAIMITDRDGVIIWVNPAFWKLTGFSSQEAIGQTPRLLKSGLPDQVFYENLWKTILAGEAWTGEIVNRHKDGTLYTEEQIITPVRDKRGDISHFIAIKQNISQRKRFEQTLQKNVELEDASRMKSEFLASMSHELRTPLNAIIGFTGTLLMKLPGPLTADQDSQLKTVQTNAKHLLSLISDLLDVAKMESGKVELSLEPVSCRQVVDDVASSMRTLAQNKGLQFEVKLPEKDFVLTTNRRALSQIIINLTKNAIKFTDKGAIQIEIGQVQKDGRMLTEIAVNDTGVGIRTEDQTKLFESFTKVNGQRAKRHEGTGLGLHLSQKLAQLLGGRISFQSEYGKGSTFTLAIEEK
jgi:protein-histidine pros-kinase